MSATKRQQDDTTLDDSQPPKKSKLPEDETNPQEEQKDGEAVVAEPKIRRRKVVLLLCYSGWGYLGMQRNPGAKTIEGDLLLAMKNAGVLSQEYYERPQLMLFQRAARTDKGVSAVRQIVSLKIPEGTDIQTINDQLPAQIRVVCMKRTTKGFNSKENCDARTYSYVLPTYAFAPPEEEPSESFRISKEITEKINQVLKNYVGTHNFHNFTFKKGFKDPSAKRFMHRFTCGEPFVRNDKEYIILTVKGQSFMQHHIRKMIGLAIAVLRGYTVEETILKAFKSDPLDIPKAPGLGLMLEEVHYDGYNKRYGSDGVHDKLDWTENEKFLNDFKEEFILKNILKTEEEEKSMLSWMTTLPGHSYSLRENRPSTVNPKPQPVVKEEDSKQTNGDGTSDVAPSSELKSEEKANDGVSELELTAEPTAKGDNNGIEAKE